MVIDNEMFGDFYIQWHITNRCNLRCSHCYQDTYTSEMDMPMPEMIEIVNNNIFPTLSKWNKKGDFSITGGEPFLRRDIFDLMDVIESSDYASRMDILSNGTFITDSIMEKLKDYPKLRYV
jgi:MoaA/NifB/PqqE/SkfB family radical SAM enzyme